MDETEDVSRLPRGSGDAAYQVGEPVDIELAAGELSEFQRQEISVEADLDSKAPAFRVLDFLEEAFLVAASESPWKVRC